jgi:hypothetical protein
MRLNIPHPLRPNSGHTEKATESRAGGPKNASRFCFSGWAPLVVDLQGLPLYNIE